MSYIGNQPTTGSFPFDQFTGNGATTAFTLTYAPAGPTSVIIAISGVVQNPNNYSVVGQTLTFSPAPPSGTNNISVLYLGLPVIGVAVPGNTAFLSSTDLTASAGQTVFAPVGSYTPGFVQVYRNGVHLGDADFTATNGTTVTLANAATAGDLVTIQYYTLTSLTNALPLTGGTVAGSTTFNAGVNLAAISGNVGIGTSSPGAKLDVTVAGANLAQQLVGTSGVYSRIGTVSSSFYTIHNGTTDTFLYTAEASALRLGTNSIERVRIDTAGRVTMPYQPAFRAVKVHSDAYAAGTEIKFGSSPLNTGSHFNSSTGRFTAPVAGVYFFAFQGLTHSVTNYFYFEIALNNQNGSTSIVGHLPQTDQAYQVVGASGCIYLNVGDFASVKAAQNGGSPYFEGRTAFSGYLIG